MAIFYPQVQDDGRIVLVNRATDVPKGTQAWDIPSDKEGLKSFIQTLLDDMHEQIKSAGGSNTGADKPRTELNADAFRKLPFNEQLQLAVIAVENSHQYLSEVDFRIEK